MFNTIKKVDPPPLQPLWDVLFNITNFIILIVFITINLFPSPALAFVSNVEFAQTPLEFIINPELKNKAIVGIEAFSGNKTVADILQSNTLNIRESLGAESTITVLSTAYSSTKAQTDSNPFITASGKRVGPGTMAANFLPFDTKVRIGNNTYTITDRMNSRYNNKYIVDIWMPNRTQALQYGAKVVELEVISLP